MTVTRRERPGHGTRTARLRGRVIAAVHARFGHPIGFWGRGAGLLMAHRSSNRRRSAWAISRLEVRPDDHVLEICFGPDPAILELSRMALVQVETLRLKPAVVCALGVDGAGS